MNERCECPNSLGSMCVRCGVQSIHYAKSAGWSEGPDRLSEMEEMQCPASRQLQDGEDPAPDWQDHSYDGSKT